MFYRVKNGKLTDCADYKYANDCFESSITTRDNYSKNEEKFSINENNELIDISNTEEYLLVQAEKEKLKLKQKLFLEIDEFDKKRIRAIAEPSVKDEETGQTWLEYYNEQIQSVRTQILDLEPKPIEDETVEEETEVEIETEENENDTNEN